MPFRRMNPVIKTAEVAVIFCKICQFSTQRPVHSRIKNAPLAFASSGNLNFTQCLIPYFSSKSFDFFKIPVRNFLFEVEPGLVRADV